VSRFVCKSALPREVVTPILQTICYTAYSAYSSVARFFGFFEDGDA
jgi:hypothetical protein